MPPISALLLLAITVGALALWTVILFRVARSLRRVPRVRDGLALPSPQGGWPKVSVVVPAHDEARVIDSCVTSLRAQEYPALSLIFVLDRCSDSTAEILRRHAALDRRIEIIENDFCPPDWAGKCHAAALGAARADGEFLIFTDADTRFHPGLVRACVAMSVDRGSSLLSLLPRLTTRRRFERVVQPVASIMLLQLYPAERVEHEETPRAFANGQFMLFRRDAYLAIGGHAAVREDLLEDLAFARVIQSRGEKVSLLIAEEMLEVSMYDSYDAFRRGWRRIFIEACRRKPSRIRKHALRLFVIGGVFPLAQVALLVLAISALPTAALWPIAAIATVCLAVAAQCAALGWLYRLLGVPLVAVAAYPFGAVTIAFLLWQSARDLICRRPIRWAGREYVLEPR